MKTLKTLVEAVAYFSDPQRAHDFVKELRWPNGVACPRLGCGSADVREIRGKRPRWYCRDCQREFTAKLNSVFEDSPIGFDKWLPAMWLISANRNGISSCELARALGVTQKTAWFMLHRIRLAMRDESFERLTDDVEADETFVGGKLRHARRYHQHVPSGIKRMGPVGKTPVLGIIERKKIGKKPRVRAWVVPNVRKHSLVPKILEHVDPKATMFTDNLLSYRHLGRHFKAHYVVNHALEYVRGDAHTNTIECFWSVFKRTLGGTYIHVMDRHHQAYLDEQIFRFVERDNTDGPRFEKAVKGGDSRRLTYKALVAKE